MNKIVVPQELQDKIIDLYVNKGYGRLKIKQALQLDFGDTVIKRILKENGIHIRNYVESQKTGGRKIPVAREVQDKIIEAYAKGYGLEKIVKELQLPFSFDKVRTVLQDNGIAIRNVKESSLVKQMPDLRKYSINDDYSFESHNGAWLLGFIAADGYLPKTKGAKNRVVITLAKKDEEILHRIAAELEYTGPLTYFVSSNGHDEVSLSFTSKNIRQKIESYGIVNNKTFKLIKIPELPDCYKLDFIRGFFDGDGSVYGADKDKKINMNIVCASKDFLQDIITYLNMKLQIAVPRIASYQRVHTIYEIRYYKKDSLTIGAAFYDNDFLSLSRKKQRFLELREKYPLRK